MKGGLPERLIKAPPAGVLGATPFQTREVVEAALKDSRIELDVLHADGSMVELCANGKADKTWNPTMLRSRCKFLYKQWKKRSPAPSIG